MAEQLWFYAKNDEQLGPVSTAELKKLAGAGELAPDDLVWREGLDDWSPASKLKGLFPETKIEGVAIKEIGTEASQTTRTYPVTLVMDQPDPSTGVKILPGMAGRASGTAELPDQAAEQGFEIPESAVFSGDDGKQYVWVIDEGGTTVRKQLVKPGTLTSIGIRVTGLDAGQWIATAGVDYLQEGQEIKILQEPGGETP